jgi:hypothetical protein
VQVLGAELSFAKWAELRSVVLGVVERDGEFRRARGTGADGEDEDGSRASHERAANEGASVEASVGA